MVNIKFSEAYLLKVASKYEHFLTPEFLVWLPKNIKDFELFCNRAEDLYNRGWRNQSGMEIVYYLRFHWKTTGEGTPFKMTNTLWPYLTRLYVLLRPTRYGLFEFVKDSWEFEALIQKLQSKGD